MVSRLFAPLTTLVNTDTRLDDNGARALANAFTCDSGGDANMQLMYLHLNNNRIGDLGATHVAKVICAHMYEFAESTCRLQAWVEILEICLSLGTRGLSL